MNRGGSARSVETVILAALVDIPRVILFPKAVMTSRNFWLRSALALSLGFYSDADYHSIVCPLWLPRGHSHSPAHPADAVSSCGSTGIICRTSQNKSVPGGWTVGPQLYSSHPDTIKGDFEFTLSVCFF